MYLRLALTTLLAHAYAQIDVTLCADTHCKEPPLATIHLTNTTGCRRDFAGIALGFKTTPVAIQGSGDTLADPPKRAQQTVRFYRSTDCFATCGSGHLITDMGGAGDGFYSLGAPWRPEPVMQSFELVELDAEGNYEPHGYCGLRHGDAQFFRGQTWKWQQIGKDAFREIPLAVWDDAVHVRLSTGEDYDMHGSVDAVGKIKMQQVMESAWHGVRLEDWDDDIHVRHTGSSFPWPLGDDGSDDQEA